MTDSEKPRFWIDFVFANTGERVRVGEPTIVDEALLDQAWYMLSDFLMDKLDEAQLDVTDEQFREAFIEICYHLVYREMTTLRNMPRREQGWKERLGTRERGALITKRGPYGHPKGRGYR